MRSRVRSENARNITSTRGLAIAFFIRLGEYRRLRSAVKGVKQVTLRPETVGLPRGCWVQPSRPRQPPGSVTVVAWYEGDVRRSVFTVGSAVWLLRHVRQRAPHAGTHLCDFAITAYVRVAA